MCPTDGIFPCGRLIPSASWWWLPPDRISCEVLAMMNVVTGVFVESALGSAREDMRCTGWSIWEKTSLLGQNNFTSIIRCADKVVRSRQSIIHTIYKLFVVPALCSECLLWPGSWTGGRRGGGNGCREGDWCLWCLWWWRCSFRTCWHCWNGIFYINILDCGERKVLWSLKHKTWRVRIYVEWKRSLLERKYGQGLHSSGLIHDLSGSHSTSPTTEAQFNSSFWSCIHYWGYPCCAEDLQHGRSKQKWILSCTVPKNHGVPLSNLSSKLGALPNHSTKTTKFCFAYGGLSPLRCLELVWVFPDVREA